jgi:hypothetical protein
VAVVGLNIARGPDIQDPEASDHELGIIMRDTAAAASTSMTEATKSTTPPGSTLTTMPGTTTPTTRTSRRSVLWKKLTVMLVCPSTQTAPHPPPQT